MTSIAPYAKSSVRSAFIPDSLYSYLMGSLRTDFSHLRSHLAMKCEFVTAEIDPNTFAKKLLEELFRYLYLLGDGTQDEENKMPVFTSICQAFHCLLLDPVLYFQVCEQILTMQCKDNFYNNSCVLPFNPLDQLEVDKEMRKARYLATIIRYKQTFGHDPPLTFWTDFDSESSLVLEKTELQSLEVNIAFATEDVSVSPSEPSPVPKQLYLRIADVLGNHVDTPITQGTRFGDVILEAATIEGQVVYEGLLLRQTVLPYSLKLRGGEAMVCTFAIGAHSIKIRDPHNNTTARKSVFTTYAVRIEKVTPDCAFELSGWQLDLYITLHSWPCKESKAQYW